MGIVNFECDVCALTDKGLVRSHNEDSNRVEQTPNGELFVVCDGMGGHVGGATASRIGVDSVCEYVMNRDCALPTQFLEDALQYANRKIFERACADPNLRGMGTTGCVALVREDTVWYAHVGDSRIYYYNAKRRTLYRLTKDHSVVQTMVDRGEITEEQAEHHPEKNKILRSLGIKNTVISEPCEKPLRPADGDILLICSDGLSGMMEEKSMLEVLEATDNMHHAGVQLIDLAKAGGGADNITVQLVKFSNTGRDEADFLPKNAGVMSNMEKKPRTSKKHKRVWPWIVIAMSVVIVGVAAAMLLTEKKNRTEVPVQPQEQVDNSPAWEKYVKEKCPNVNPETFSKNGIEYEIYKKTEYPDGSLYGVCVDRKHGTYEEGQFKSVPKDGKRIYVAAGDVKRFNKDGIEIR